MAKKNVSAQLLENGEVKRKVTVEYDFGENLKDMIKLFGEEKVANHARASMVVALQGIIRNRLKVKEGETAPTDAELQKVADEWKPSDPRERTTPVERVSKLAASMTAEERAALIKQLQGA